MEDSLLDRIPQVCHMDYIYDGWPNGMAGTISGHSSKPEYRFYQAFVDDKGNYRLISRAEESAPLVAIGIVFYWLQHRVSNNRLTNILSKPEQFKKNIREQFESYTDIRFSQFKTQHKDDPNSWNWDWNFEFYCKYIIPHELELNKLSEALFEYINEDDIKLVRSVMNNYIEFLKTRRTELGYEMNPELIVLRYLQSNNVFDLEGMSKTKLNVIYTELEGKKLIKVYRLDESTPWDIRILDAGLLRIDEMENEAHSQLSEIERLRKENAELRAKLESKEETSEEEIIKNLTPCFYGSKEDACAFLTQIKAVNADKYKPAIAKKYLNQNKLSPLSARGELYNILKRHKLYSKGVGNWNQLLKKA